jgi:predicted site-specific integrase-resolvase
MSQPMPTLDEVRNWPATVAVQDAARALGVSRSTAYEWVRIGQFPCAIISVGHKHRVITAGLIRLLSQTGNDEAS